MSNVLMDLFYLVIVSWLPSIELRGGIPLGISMGFDPWLIFALVTSTNLLIMPIGFLFLDRFFPYFERFAHVEKVISRIRKKTHKFVEKYGSVGLALLVAVPLPGSGVYTGTFGAYLLGMNRRKSFLAIIAGSIIAGLLVTLLSVGAFSVWNALA